MEKTESMKKIITKGKDPSEFQCKLGQQKGCIECRFSTSTKKIEGKLFQSKTSTNRGKWQEKREIIGKFIVKIRIIQNNYWKRVHKGKGDKGNFTD